MTTKIIRQVSINFFHSLYLRQQKLEKSDFHHCVQNIIGRVRKRKTTVYLDRAIQRKVKADRRESTSSMKAVIETEFRIINSEQTVRRRLHKAGFKGCVAKQKPYVDKTNRMKRIQYAKRYREQPLCFWDQVLLTNESNFNLFGSDGKVMV